MSKITLIFIVTYVSGIVSALSIDASFGIYLYEVEYFVNPTIRWWYGNLPDLRYSFIIAVSILAGYVIHSGRYTENKIMAVPQYRWLLALVALMGLLSPIAVWPAKHTEIYNVFVKLAAFVFLVYKLIDTPKKFERLIWAFLIGSFYIGWVAHGSGRTGFGRLEGIGPSDAEEANSLAAVLITSVPLFIFYISEGKRMWQKAVAALFLAYVLDGIVLINSRGAFLGIIGGMLYFSYFVVFRNIRSTAYKVKLMGGLLLGVALFVYMTDQTFWQRMDTLNDVEQTSVTEEGIEVRGGGASRTFFWQKGIELAQQHPLGVGGWGYLYLSPSFLPKDMLSEGMRAPHSTWVSALVDLGYLGFLFFVGYLFSTLCRNRKTRKYLHATGDGYLYYQNIALTSGFIAFLIASSFIDRVYAEMMYWLPTFMACFSNIYYTKPQLVSMSEPVSESDTL